MKKDKGAYLPYWGNLLVRVRKIVRGQKLPEEMPGKIRDWNIFGAESFVAHLRINHKITISNCGY